MMTVFLHIAIGGALGSVARHAVTLGMQRLFGSGFPWGTLSVNVVGSALIGLAWVWLSREGAPRLSPVLMTGFLGGFTTFSALSLDALRLWDQGMEGSAALYVVLSVVLSLGGVALGVALARGLA